MAVKWLGWQPRGNTGQSLLKSALQMQALQTQQKQSQTALQLDQQKQASMENKMALEAAPAIWKATKGDSEAFQKVMGAIVPEADPKLLNQLSTMDWSQPQKPQELSYQERIRNENLAVLRDREDRIMRSNISNAEKAKLYKDIEGKKMVVMGINDQKPQLSAEESWIAENSPSSLQEAIFAKLGIAPKWGERPENVKATAFANTAGKGYADDALARHFGGATPATMSILEALAKGVGAAGNLQFLSDDAQKQIGPNLISILQKLGQKGKQAGAVPGTGGVAQNPQEGGVDHDALVHNYDIAKKALQDITADSSKPAVTRLKAAKALEEKFGVEDYPEYAVLHPLLDGYNKSWHEPNDWRWEWQVQKQQQLIEDLKAGKSSGPSLPTPFHAPRAFDSTKASLSNNQSSDDKLSPDSPGYRPWMGSDTYRTSSPGMKRKKKKSDEPLDWDKILRAQGIYSLPMDKKSSEPVDLDKFLRGE